MSVVSYIVNIMYNCLHLFLVFCAEVKVATMLVQNNLPLAVADELTPSFVTFLRIAKLLGNMPPDKLKQLVLLLAQLHPIFSKFCLKQ